MAPAEIAELTGLPMEKAALAREREFTEPFIITRPDDIGPFSDLAAGAGLKVTRGGRFHHLMGREQDKGEAVRIVMRCLQAEFRSGVYDHRPRRQ